MKKQRGNFSPKSIMFIHNMEKKAEQELLKYQWTYATVIFFLSAVCAGITLAI